MKTNICKLALVIASGLLPIAVFAAEIAPKPLDGVMIEAVEAPPNLKNHQLALGTGVYPFNAYYTGFLINFGYTYNISPEWSWEILNVNYAYAVQNGLATELAEMNRLNPDQITRLNFLVSSTGHYTFLKGKYVLLKNYIRYFRMTGLFGLGLAMTNKSSSIAVPAGLRMEAFTNENFSWFLDARDTVAASSFTNYITLTLGMNFGI